MLTSWELWRIGNFHTDKKLMSYCHTNIIQYPGYLNFKSQEISKVISEIMDLESNLKNVESHSRCKKNPGDKLRAVSLRLQQGVDQTAGKLYVLYVPCPLDFKREM